MIHEKLCPVHRGLIAMSGRASARKIGLEAKILALQPFPPEGVRIIAQDKQSAVLGEQSKRSINPVGAARKVSNPPASVDRALV
jgi:hypothetical protein